MKKIFFAGIAAMMFSGLFTSCSHDLGFDSDAMERNIKNTYEQAFTSRFGTPAPNQDWGFGTSQSSARTRGIVRVPMVENGVPTFNATLATMSDSLAAVIGQVSNSDQFLPFKGWWNSGWTDKYYQINASAINSNLSDEYLTHIKDVLLTQIPENGNNLAKAISTGYTITTKGGPVTLTPIYHNSSSGDLISYYYYPANTTPTVAEIKAMKKYTIGNMADPNECQSNHYAFHHQTFSLVFEDANGNVSYNFPEGYVINFMIANTDNGNGTLSIFDGVNNGQTQTKTIAKHPEYYGDGRLNTEIHATQDGNSPLRMYSLPNAVGLASGITNVETPHVAVFKIGDKNFVGFEDWTDFDYNDVIFEVTGTDGGEELPDDDDYEEIRVIAEDLTVGQSTDFDFNDVVFDVRRYLVNTKAKHQKNDVEIILRAAGGTLPLYVDGHEVHNAFGVSVKTMVNTNAHARGLNGSDNAGIRIFPVDIDKEEADKMTIGEIANSIRVYVTKNGVDCDLEAPVGGIASKIGVKCNYEWCDEREDIDNKYKLVDGTPLFKNYVQGIFPVDGWYNYAKKEIDEYKAAMLP